MKTLFYKPSASIRYVYFSAFMVCLLMFTVNMHAATPSSFPEKSVDFNRQGFIDTEVNAGDLGICGNSPKSVEALVYTRSFVLHRGVFAIGARNAPGRDFSLVTLGGTDQWRVVFWSNDIDFSHPSKNRWVHFAIVYDGREAIIYADGKEKARASRQLNTSDDDTLRMGRWWDREDGIFDGKIAELRIWDRALDKDEVNANINASLQGNEEGLVAMWPLEEGSGRETTDLVEGYSGWFHGEPEWVLAKPFERTLPKQTPVTPSENIVLGPVEMRTTEDKTLYRWHFNDEPIEGADEKFLEVSDIDIGRLGRYSVVLDDDRNLTPVETSTRVNYDPERLAKEGSYEALAEVILESEGSEQKDVLEIHYKAIYAIWGVDRSVLEQELDGEVLARIDSIQSSVTEHAGVRDILLLKELGEEHPKEAVGLLWKILASGEKVEYDFYRLMALWAINEIHTDDIDEEKLSGIESVAAVFEDEPWHKKILDARRALVSCGVADSSEWQRKAWEEILSFDAEYPIQSDWFQQDWGEDFQSWLGMSESLEVEKEMIGNVLDHTAASEGLSQRLEALMESSVSADEPAWLELYTDAREQHRSELLEPLLEVTNEIVFAKHYNLGGSHYAYTEGLSNAQGERHFEPGTELSVFKFDGIYGKERTLIEDSDGVIRNPDVSLDGERVLFSWKKSDREDDYSLYEKDLSSGEVRQLTSGLGHADYEGIYLPDGNIMFNSTRCVQIVDCWWTEVSNFFIMDGDGNHMRRVGFDQVHTNFPTLMEDGRVVYTRWDYNDRGQLYPQGLFHMFPDGTNQTEFYGNNSFFPTTLIHARSIPGTRRVMAVFTGHHTFQAGKLGIVDPSRGRQENKGAQLIAPPRDTEAERVDRYGQLGDLFQYPYPITEDKFLVSYSPDGWPRQRPGAQDHRRPRFGIYMMDINGRRELLVSDPENSCNQPLPIAPRDKIHRVHERQSMVEYKHEAQEESGTFFVQDVYEGPGLEGVERGTIERLRVVALDYRAAGTGMNLNPAIVSTPVAVPGGTWDVKEILGTVEVHEDGSSLFEAPARRPIFFQALDADGHAVQSMRSWTTLQPGEHFSCVGCHEHRNTAPPAEARMSQAMESGMQQIEPFYGPPRGFSYPEEVQPVLDKHCIECHNPGNNEDILDLTDRERPGATHREDGRRWYQSYLNLTGYGYRFAQGGSSLWREKGKGPTFSAPVNWVGAQSRPPLLPPYFVGASQSPLIEMLEDGHGGVELSREEMDKIVTWIDLAVPFAGDYMEAHDWSEKEVDGHKHFYNKRMEQEEQERKGIRSLIESEEQRTPGH